MKVTVIGSGNMGSAFVKQFVRAGHTVKVIGRDLLKATQLAAQYADVQAVPANTAAHDADAHGLRNRRPPRSLHSG